MPAIHLNLQETAAVLLVPPVNLVLLALLAMLLRWRLLAALALLALLALALPVVSDALLAGLETGLAAPPGVAAPQAIVILGGDMVDIVARPGVADVGPLTLARLRAGAALSRATHLPILVTGGVVLNGDPPVATLMASSLTADFGVPPRWVESASNDTWENARLSTALLRHDGIGAVYVVTHAWHMRRALQSFAGTGLAVTPAPLPGDPTPWRNPAAYVPRVASWVRSYLALHEWIGGAWYAWRS
jgi:uncharacterized SAM-binding protein YcdF (DUF218 family)